MPSVSSKGAVTEIRLTLLPKCNSIPLSHSQRNKKTKTMKYRFLRHWKSGSKGQQALRGDKQTRWILPWAQVPAFSEFPGWAPRGGLEVNPLDSRSWVLVENRAARVHRTKIQSFALQSRSRDTDVENKGMDIKGERGVGGIGKLGFTYIRYWCYVYSK